MKRLLSYYFFVVAFVLQSTHCSATYKVIYKIPSPPSQQPLLCSKCNGLCETKSSYPYITGCTFRSICNFILDHEANNLDPKKVSFGDLIFVSHDYIEIFFKRCRPQIQQPFILITHHCFGDGDASTPGPYAHYLEDEQLIAWFTVNPSIVHPKIKPLPLGIANSFYPIGDTAVYDYHIKKFRSIPKTKLLYSNFYAGNCPQEREYVHHYFLNKNFCSTAPRKPQSEYLIDMAEHKFVLSPRGNGLDCYRTWEALFIGSIPIVRSSAMDAVFDNLPVLIIDRWEELTEEFLEKKYEEIGEKINLYNFEKLYIPYWINEILKCQFRARLKKVQ